jgi:DNA-binding response OmpR family regulator
MKVAVFENEHLLINSIFETVNFAFFNSTLEFKYVPSSQSLPFESLSQYHLIIVDIDLSQKSDLDGYGLIAKIHTLENPPPILILTGHSNIEETLKKRGLPSYPILTKPIGIEDTKEALKKFFPENS